MLTAEGLLDGLQQKLSVDLTSVCTAIESIRSQFQLLIIQVEVPEEDIKEFYIGHAVLLDSVGVQFDEFDALGNWESKSSLISFSNIAFIQFETPYIKTFSKYLGGPPPSHDD